MAHPEPALELGRGLSLGREESTSSKASSLGRSINGAEDDLLPRWAFISSTSTLRQAGSTEMESDVEARPTRLRTHEMWVIVGLDGDEEEDSGAEGGPRFERRMWWAALLFSKPMMRT